MVQLLIEKGEANVNCTQVRNISLFHIAIKSEPLNALNSFRFPYMLLHLALIQHASKDVHMAYLQL